ncbi:MAG: argininosuccinate lyase [Oscillospiraceae bacterium]|jgi:argininosuccinate lyase|nr:argininosuccinate lyase [Oscillospiraceae bacterium]
MDKLWKGRFSKETDSKVNDFNSSFRFDCRMWREDIEGSMAHAEMLGKCGIISQSDSERIIEGLERIKKDIESGKLQFDSNAEDIHTFIETELTAQIGEAGKKLHTARSRNDQTATDLRLYLRREIEEIQELLHDLRVTVCAVADEHENTIMPGYTHLQRAQPVTFASHLDAYAAMFWRDDDRLDDVIGRMMKLCPLGCAALAGTTYPIDREMTAESLGFKYPCVNTLDGVSDRDFCIEIVSALAIIMMHLSRFSEEIILWCSWEFRFIELDDAYATGSSIMPQKKNPDIAELVRGKAARVFADLQTLLVMMKGLPLAYNKDMQEDKEAIFDAVDTVKMCLEVFAPMLATMTVNKARMREAAAQGFINATDCADYLVKKGMAFRDAYKITGELVALCIEKNTDLENLPLDEYKGKSGLFSEDIFEAIRLETCVRNRIGKD